MRNVTIGTEAKNEQSCAVLNSRIKNVEALHDLQNPRILVHREIPVPLSEILNASTSFARPTSILFATLLMGPVTPIGRDRRSTASNSRITAA